MLLEITDSQVLQVKARSRLLNIAHTSQCLLQKRCDRLRIFGEIDHEAKNGDRGVV